MLTKHVRHSTPSTVKVKINKREMMSTDGACIEGEFCPEGDHHLGTHKHTDLGFPLLQKWDYIVQHAFFLDCFLASFCNYQVLSSARSSAGGEG